MKPIGRRGFSLLFFALLDFVYCASFLFVPPETRDTPSFKFITNIMPAWAWAVLWGGVGLTCAVGAFRKKDRVAFMAAAGLKWGWGTIYFLGWLLADFPRGYLGAAIWWALATWVLVLAGWPEAHER